MNRFEQWRTRSETRRRNQPNRSHQRRSRIAENISEHIRAQDYVKLRRPQRQLHRRIVHVHVLQLYRGE